MVALAELVAHLDQLLDTPRQGDFCPNGLQVEGSKEVRRLVTGVTASRELFEKAQDLGADAILVHHGIFWKGWEPRISGLMKGRVGFLLEHGISLISYHLPLDRHPELGNNAQILKRLELEPIGGFAPYQGQPVGSLGTLARPLEAEAFFKKIGEVFQTVPLRFAFGPESIERVAVLSGKGDHDFEKAAAAGADLFLTGEAGVSTRDLARELGVHYVAAGHHATERFGVQAVGAHLAETFDLEHSYLEVPNPV